MSWEPLAASDPVPGDPGAVDAAAQSLTAAAGQLAEHRQVLAGFDPVGIWKGFALDTFLDHRSEALPVLEAVVARHDRAASALLAYSSELAGAQADARSALAVAQAADADRSAAIAGLREVAAVARTYRQHGEEVPPWDGPDHQGALAAADDELARARRLLDDAVARRDEAADAAGVAVRAAGDDAIADGGGWLGMLRRLFGGGGAERIDGSGAVDFVMTDEGLVLNTRESWQWEANAHAGIDPEAWDPSAGLAANDQIIRDLYDYYGTLNLGNPELLWAGMAHLAGGVLYGGWQDLYVVRTLASEVERVEAIRALFGASVPDAVVSVLAGATADELEFFETAFLGMAQDVFVDMAWMHEAYAQGGIEAMQELRADGALSSDAVADAWEDIASGDRDRIAAGNAALLDQEQRVVLQPSYQAIHDYHGPVGIAFTQALGWVSESPVPGGRPFRDVVTVQADVDLDLPDEVTGCLTPWGPCQTIDTPDRITTPDLNLPFRNISAYADRDEWLQKDMLPAGQELFFENPEEARKLMETSTEELAEDHRLIPLPYDP